MVCCVTGHRPSGFPFPREEVNPLFLHYYLKVLDDINEWIGMGCDRFITGMAEGADVDFAIAVLDFKKDYHHIQLEAALPYPVQQPKKCSDYHRKREQILAKCDKVHLVSDHFYRGCMDKRNRFMVDQADVVYAIWNGKKSGGTWNTIKYAQKCGKTVRYLMLNELDGFGMQHL
ncbi:MAG: DUF1273 family protein [Clostridia bacterium]|nr:DUF1273 family protein [Clostridia bacterium]